MFDISTCMIHHNTITASLSNTESDDYAVSLSNLMVICVYLAKFLTSVQKVNSPICAIARVLKVIYSCPPLYKSNTTPFHTLFFCYNIKYTTYILYLCVLELSFVHAAYCTYLTEIVIKFAQLLQLHSAVRH